jgi:hypothetical protein
MTALKRLRIIFFALMIFGAFANFAQNEWGISIIVLCELLMAFSFLAEVILKLFRKLKERKKLTVTYLQLGALATLFLTFILLNVFKSEMLIPIFLSAMALLTLTIIFETIYDSYKKLPSQGIYDAFFLFFFFIGMVAKNNRWAGASVFLILSCASLLPYYFSYIIRFLKNNYQSGKSLVSVLSVGSLAGVLLSLSFLFKTMHWPFATIMFYISLSLTSIMILGTLKWRYEFKGEKINILKGIALLEPNIILIYFMAFTFCFYSFLVVNNLAPKFYSQELPEAVDKLSNTGLDGEKKARELKDVYRSFITNLDNSGLLK